jgi:hypothetical protein
MGMARLLAKGWVVFCAFAAAHELVFAFERGSEMADATRTVLLCTFLFAAMGLLFVGGYAAATDHGQPSILTRIRTQHFVPGFDGLVFVIFGALSFANQVWFSPQFMDNDAVKAMTAAIHFVVPAQRAFEAALEPHGLDGGRIFDFAFAWLLGAIYFASAATRLRLTAGLIRLERTKQPEALGASMLTFLLGALAVVAIQFLFMGTAFTYLPETIYTEIIGMTLIGLGPLLFAYLLIAALANLLASGPE